MICCGGGNEKSLKNIPKALYAAVLQGDIETIRALTTEKLAEGAVKAIEEVKKRNITISELKVLDVIDISKDAKDIRIEFIMDSNPEEGQGTPEKQKTKQVFHLNKIDKKWKVEKVDDVSSTDIS